MKNLNLEIISPSKKVYSGAITSITIPGTSGSFQVLVNHAPIISSFEVGIIKVIEQDNSVKYFTTAGGTVEVLNNQVLVLADSVEKVEEIDLERAKAAKKRAEERLQKKTDKDIDVQRAKLALARALNRLSAAEKYLTVSK